MLTYKKNQDEFDLQIEYTFEFDRILYKLPLCSI